MSLFWNKFARPLAEKLRKATGNVKRALSRLEAARSYPAGGLQGWRFVYRGDPERGLGEAAKVRAVAASDLQTYDLLHDVEADYDEAPAVPGAIPFWQNCALGFHHWA